MTRPALKQIIIKTTRRQVTPAEGNRCAVRSWGVVCAVVTRPASCGFGKRGAPGATFGRNGEGLPGGALIIDGSGKIRFIEASECGIFRAPHRYREDDRRASIQRASGSKLGGPCRSPFFSHGTEHGTAEGLNGAAKTSQRKIDAIRKPEEGKANPLLKEKNCLKSV